MGRGNCIGRVRRLRAIRPVFLIACDNSGRIKSHQATAFSGEPKTPMNFKFRLVGQVLQLGTQRANLNFQAHRRFARRRPCRRLERRSHAFTVIRLEHVPAGRPGGGRAVR